MKVTIFTFMISQVWLMLFVALGDINFFIQSLLWLFGGVICAYLEIKYELFNM